MSARPVVSQFVMWLFGPLLCLLVGCGDSNEEYVPPPPAAPAAGGFAGGGGGAPAAVRAPVPVNPKPSPANNKVKSGLPDVNEDDVDRLFEMGENLTNYEVVSVGEPRPQDVFALYQGSPQENSSTVTIIPPPVAVTTITPLAGFVLPEGFVALDEYGLMAPGVPRRIKCEADGSIMAFVPRGAFQQGQEGVSPEVAPAHPSYVDDYYMDVTEVTLQQYDAFRSEQKMVRPKEPINKNSPLQHPALGVTYRDLIAYAKWSGKAIPKEAEWEKAARGELNFRYPWGDGRPIWTSPRKPGQIDAVGSHPNDISPYGLLDMAGNAREWCEDWYDSKAYREAVTPDGSAVVNWAGPKKAEKAGERVVKGSGSRGWETWSRVGMPMAAPADDVGMRLVLRVSIPQE
ncbi:MAG: SUMF1/EgtB/PvdO family nonheme iron enzyme [Planctomycetaceae bacterium]